MYKVILKEQSITSTTTEPRGQVPQITERQDALLSPSSSVKLFFREVFPLERA